MKHIAATILPLALVAAACHTPYGEITADGGVQSAWLSPTLLQITARGNHFSSVERIRDYGLLSAAEKADEAGYRYFVVRNTRDETKTVATYTPVTSTTRLTDDRKAAITTQYGGTPIYGDEPGHTTTYEMFQDVPPDYRTGQYYQVAVVLADLKAKYIDPKR